MSNCIFDSMNVENNETKLMMKKIQAEVSEFIKSNEAQKLIYNQKFAELYNYLKDNLSNSIRVQLDTMINTGELDTIITNAINFEIGYRNDREVYFNGVTSKKIWDTESSTYYYVTRIPRRDEEGNIISLNLGIANDDESFSELESTIDFAHRHNATVCINAGVFNVDTDKPLGILIKDGAILHSGDTTDVKYGYLGITRDSQYRYYEENTPASRMITDGCIHAVCIFNSLIKNGNPTPQTDDRREPRQSIGFTIDNEIIVITCDGRDDISDGMTYTDLVRLHAMYNSYNAVILDGGGSSSTVVRGVKQNENVDYLTVDRKVSSFLYVKKDSIVSPDNNSSNEIGKAKQSLLERIINKVEFVKGFIRLRHTGFQPGIEMYVNNEEKRRCKFGISVDSTNERNTYAYIGVRAGEVEKSNLFRVYDQGVWCQTYNGPSGSRPIGVVGLQYFDTTINKPIWYTGTEWVDSTGTKV